MILGWQGYTLHLFESGISNHSVSNCVIYVRHPNADCDCGPVGERAWGGRGGGVNGRFIYHQCHSLPERKSALLNWNIAEFTLLIRALSVFCPRLSSKREQHHWHIIESGLMWRRSFCPQRPGTARPERTIKWNKADYSVNLSQVRSHLYPEI